MHQIRASNASAHLGSGTVLPLRMLHATAQHKLSPVPSTSAAADGSLSDSWGFSSAPSRTVPSPDAFV
ncbi:uncharacterized protein BT62DRAFT_936845 [Guyanagaster necrorhizus]|uniref:Uncharacterized protein n=1 Tax=Guyanagaster necrorhizus TaxID=856835 RepID=A0A9P8AND8_9AGAR|nr:uncharacterized protein BT62DRAFT_936845 [Guyanagaster necrorhizus MCA 3950]KAG7441724.1 hypothetical protein BT62DRAFT_936845 [Guyanagaster necrorhizus MCA 3950]